MKAVVAPRKAIVALAMVASLGGCGPTRTPEFARDVQTDDQWRATSGYPRILATLQARRIEGCEVSYVRKLSAYAEKYLVICRDERRAWTGYTVWPNTGTVEGPDYDVSRIAGMQMPKA